MVGEAGATLGDTLRALREQMAEQRGELAMLIKQAEMEVERRRQRVAVVTERLAELDRHLDRYTKSELRDLYDAARETHMRCFMMESQLDGLRQREGYLARVDTMLGQVEHDALAATAQPAPAATPSLPPRTVRSAPSLLFDALERDRLRVSRQVHDGPAQALSSVVLRAEICERLLDVDPTEARVEMTRLKEALANAVLEIRRIIFELRPMMLEDLGLVPTLRRYLQARAARDDLTIDIIVEGGERRLPIEAEVALFRVAQDALANVRRHAGVAAATLTVEFTPAQVAVTVSDRGRGFVLDDTLAASAARGAGGLWAMEQRAALVGGRLQVESEPGRGCRVRVAVPVPASASA